MNQFGQHIIDGLAGKLSLEDKSVEELEMLVSQHPYFGFAQLLLANKLKESNSEAASTTTSFAITGTSVFSSSGFVILFSVIR